MQSIEANIENTKQGLYLDIWPDSIYYSAFHDDLDGFYVVLPYVQDIKYQCMEEIEKSHVEATETVVAKGVEKENYA